MLATQVLPSSDDLAAMERCRPVPLAGGSRVAPTRVTTVTGPDPYRQLKDASITTDGDRWHLYGTGWRADDALIVHATAPRADGPYEFADEARLEGVLGPRIAAPGVIVADGRFHMFIQTDFAGLGGTIEHLVSDDGTSFERIDTALTSDVASGEGCIYDAEPALIGGVPHLAYAAAAEIGRPELHLARSLTGTWSGPWERLGPVLRQTDVPFHNQVGCGGYEWGLEGPQILELPNGAMLLLGVCFLAGAGKGRRQRLFSAWAPSVLGPYTVLGPLIDPLTDTWESGENGHAGAALVDGSLVLVYQARRGAGEPWSYGSAILPVPV